MKRPTPLPTLYVEPRFPVRHPIAMLVAALLCTVFLLGYVGPALDEYDAAKATAAAKRDAQAQAARVNRLERAAAVMCGRHGWQLIPDNNTVQCGGKPGPK